MLVQTKGQQNKEEQILIAFKKWSILYRETSLVILNTVYKINSFFFSVIYTHSRESNDVKERRIYKIRERESRCERFLAELVVDEKSRTSFSVWRHENVLILQNRVPAAYIYTKSEAQIYIYSYTINLNIYIFRRTEISKMRTSNGLSQIFVTFLSFLFFSAVYQITLVFSRTRLSLSFVLNNFKS